MHTDGMDRLTNLLGALSLALVDEMQSAATEITGRAGAAGSALAVLAQEPGLGIEALRRPLGLSQSAAVRVVDGLVADGLAHRSPGRDGRSVAVTLTARGRREAAAVLAARAQVLEPLLAGVVDRDRRVLERFLERGLTALTRDADHAEHLCRLCDLRACPEATCPATLAGCAAAPGDPDRTEPGG
jgi:MarR family transcriptional regulator, negative regulator of the multidrug operon emrRAB